MENVYRWLIHDAFLQFQAKPLIKRNEEIKYLKSPLNPLNYKFLS